MGLNPFTKIVPEVGLINPTMAFIKVDLPAPFAPISPIILPSFTLNDTSLKAVTLTFLF